MSAKHLHNSLPDRITPPGSLVASPLTPPPTDSKPTKLVRKILDILRQCKDGRYTSESPWRTYRIQRKEYDDLIGLVKKERSLWAFIEDKFRYSKCNAWLVCFNFWRFRYDYDSLTEVLTLRMPSYAHELFLARVVEEIQNKLREFTTTDSRSKAFARNIKHNGSPKLVLQSENNNDNQAIIKREPDATFHYRGAYWPGVIIEVSYSQKTKALPHLADDYILETNGNVHAVIGLDINYQTGKGSISMWRPDLVENRQGRFKLKVTQTLHNQVRRSLIEY